MPCCQETSGLKVGPSQGCSFLAGVSIFAACLCGLSRADSFFVDHRRFPSSRVRAGFADRRLWGSIFVRNFAVGRLLAEFRLQANSSLNVELRLHVVVGMHGCTYVIICMYARIFVLAGYLHTMSPFSLTQYSRQLDLPARI